MKNIGKIGGSSSRFQKTPKIQADSESMVRRRIKKRNGEIVEKPKLSRPLRKEKRPLSNEYQKKTQSVDDKRILLRPLNKDFRSTV